ncbi:hypothetical protein M8J76_014976 [Diaphorina citri]|nr:hypothetical protein M8J76_014976 [Diaphorina citri]KAI5755405.1 hypothetical protein M8J77_016523 [Diaphorina citri]
MGLLKYFKRRKHSKKQKIQDIPPESSDGISKCEGSNMIDQGPIPLPVLATRGMNLPPSHMNPEPEGLILPKKPHNPCIDSNDRQNLHRELMFNQKIGKNVLNQKSELQRALEKHKDHQLKKEIEREKLESKTPFEKVIEERAKRLETLECQDQGDSIRDKDTPEFLQVHAKLRAKMESK